MHFNDLEDRVYFTSSPSDAELINQVLEKYGNEDSAYYKMSKRIIEAFVEDLNDPCFEGLEKVLLTGEYRKKVLPYFFDYISNDGNWGREFFLDIELAESADGYELGRNQITNRVTYNIDTNYYYLGDFI